MMTEVKEFKFDETKLFECETECLDTNFKHPIFRLDNVGVSDVGIVVTGYDGKPIGAVEFTLRSDGQVVASLKLEYSCPERLDVENGQVYLDVGWYLGDEAVDVFDVEVSVDWIEAEHAQLTLVKPYFDSKPIRVK